MQCIDSSLFTLSTCLLGSMRTEEVKLSIMTLLDQEISRNMLFLDHLRSLLYQFLISSSKVTIKRKAQNSVKISTSFYVFSGYNKIEKESLKTPEEFTQFIVDCFESATERDIYTGRITILFDFERETKKQLIFG